MSQSEENLKDFDKHWWENRLARLKDYEHTTIRNEVPKLEDFETGDFVIVLKVDYGYISYGVRASSIKSRYDYIESFRLMMNIIRGYVNEKIDLTSGFGKFVKETNPPQKDEGLEYLEKFIDDPNDPTTSQGDSHKA